MATFGSFSMIRTINQITYSESNQWVDGTIKIMAFEDLVWGTFHEFE
ncbi:hypothetical protein SS1G_00918 [Sclerotinia sclerotiorum 1980 UF-70]|uniref:Uncharacterized protein n=1 Tax=Sclerotinia sclerotiorum (strain ATCC 18683 / 1980 / Ss-1) TaxID=665079 RepID=A7E6J3_SCLS1|nr:hypothetical protein SS1G_00918 [Sclerotinia sclerotiorum 1980 UF-70]EDN91515.1 hypothetical protein SS1G_00918 [Sclerotinia sclerotiorum 1980 UF-70]